MFYHLYDEPNLSKKKKTVKRFLALQGIKEKSHILRKRNISIKQEKHKKSTPVYAEYTPSRKKQKITHSHK